MANIKGRAEKNLLALAASDSYPSLIVYNARPLAVDPPPEAKPPAFPDRSIIGWGQYLRPVMRLFIPTIYYIPGDKLAEALVALASRDGKPFEEDFPGVVPGSGGMTLLNRGLRAVAGLT